MSTSCRRCGREGEPLEKPPIPGNLGIQIHQSVCADCWAEWLEQEVKVINELRLNFMDPEAQETLARHLREFLFLDP